uniref:Inorganic pyrophosphatase 2 n=1 Tax=Ananas comosus var. bracteatus TaxID=296719 RepID=A0A6V7QQA5_ANACO
MAGIVVVFDFDKTIIDCDSDNWVVDDFGATERFDILLETMPWNTAIDKIMGEIHSQGRAIEEIGDCLTKAPISPHVIKAIKAAHALGCELRIVSDANTFFIETILKHHGLIEYFTEINTNPGFVDDEGRLRIFPYHDFTTSSHGCGLCPPNMCKGIIIERIRASAFSEGKKHLVYLAKVHEWSDGEELEKVLLQLINESLSADRCDNIVPLRLAADFKCHTVPLPSSPGALPKALPVPH